ncbi:hypothetical protein BUALT_Bualt05G0124900 [Buddleja alternifolia]|uniref:Cotton fiber protein n=1 Tax=Buddleja alternifolia TaxID=168488 RepID=A0AAV6XQL5_9LAMI|nr:hypothetical protein BUALT_Bualt05G0124900 [Buddleja alternifolia]
MAKKKSLFLQKLSNLLKLSIFLAKLKKPTIPKLIFLKTRRAKEFKLLDHYEFSPSSTPLIRFRGKFPRNGRISFRKVYANMLLISECLGRVRDEGEKEIHCLENFQIDLSNSCSEDDCVDERAERFIERFYEEMRRQRYESNFQMNSMVEM